MAQHGSLGCAKDPSSSTGRTEGAPDRDPEGPPPELWSHPSTTDAASYPNSGMFPQLKRSNKDRTDTSQPRGPQGRGVS